MSTPAGWWQAAGVDVVAVASALSFVQQNKGLFATGVRPWAISSVPGDSAKSPNFFLSKLYPRPPVENTVQNGSGRDSATRERAY